MRSSSSTHRTSGLSAPLRQIGLALCFLPLLTKADMVDTGADLNALPQVPEGYSVSIFAKEPLVQQPCSMAFDAKGRLFIGMGPQYRNPKPDTPGDSVCIIEDMDGDGVADSKKVFATGLNCIQSLAWHGRDLWVANAPDLTIVRDLDGDDVADEYVKVFTDLGNIEHALHGLVWAPDGKLYMSKGNSKGLNDPQHPERIAPAPFRELFGQTTTQKTTPPQTFKAADYKHTYQNPQDDWGLMGGILRCDDMGENLEIFARGFRNPWDIAHDDGFNWLCTDNDQNEGDRVMMPFYGAHFGWNHPWSSDWTGEDHLPTVPVSHEVFHGSGTGIVFGSLGEHRGVFFINDWLNKTTFIFKPKWDGALMKCEGDKRVPFIVGGQSLFRPTDIAFGPDGALWCLSWSRGYGAEYDKDGKMTSEGRIYRIDVASTGSRSRTAPGISFKPMQDRSVKELVAAFNSPLPVHRIDAQDELARRGKPIQNELGRELERDDLTQAQQTWGIGALGRIAPIMVINDGVLSEDNVNIQTLRSSMRNPKSITVPDVLRLAATEDSARMRFEVVQAIWQSHNAEMVPLLMGIASKETDRLTYYCAWRALRDLASTELLKRMLKDSHAGVRRAAMLALLEDGALSREEVTSFTKDADADTAKLANLWIKNHSGDAPEILVKGNGINSANVAPIKGTPPEIKPPSTPTTLDAALASMKDAKAERGRLLVLHPQGAGCIPCHYIAGRGNHFGPDLTNIGDRAEVKHLLQSMIDPSAVITEGFNSHVITTAKATHMGVLLDESGLAVTLGLATGQRERILRSDITKHETLPVSAMPPFNATLTPQQCADIAAWLMTQRAGGGKKEKTAKSDGIEPLRVTKESTRLVITQAKQPVAEFYFADAKVKRPCFADLRVPGGIKVTRNFPPIEGKDATDHADLHPGLWLGFGDINGSDFWRNKATMRHDKFLAEPEWKNNALTFATQCTLLSNDGKDIGRMDTQFTLKPTEQVVAITWDSTFHATTGDLLFGDQEEMGFGARVATAITEKSGGIITSSTKATTAKNTWGQPAAWCDYSGVINGRHVGITLVPDPANPQPGWWHNRDYGVFVANCFGRQAMKQGDKASLVVKQGQSLRLRYTALLHTSPDDKPFDVAKLVEKQVTNSH